MVAVRMKESRGNSMGNRSLRAMCPPGPNSVRRTLAAHCVRVAHRRAHGVSAVASRRLRVDLAGGALCGPLVGATARPGANTDPWRERPPVETAWAAKPAATEVVAHATLNNLGAHVVVGSSEADTASVLPVRPSRRSTTRSCRCSPGDPRAELRRVTRARTVFGSQQESAASPPMISTKNIGHHMISIELCSASSRLSLRSTLRARP